MRKIPTLLAALMLSAGIATSAMADAFTDKIVADLQAQGYVNIEIKIYASTVKVEANDGTNKVEVIYDRETGAVLKQESETVEPGEDTSAKVEIDDRSDREDGSGHGGDDDEDEDEDDDHSGHGHDGDDDDEDDDDDHSGHGGDDDDDEDEDEDDDSGHDSDDDEDDSDED